MPRGGKRPGAGIKKGHVFSKTIEKALAREELRAYIRLHLPDLLAAQLASAKGIKYLVTRAPNGKFTVVTEAMARAMSKKGAQNTEIIEVWEKGANFQAFKEFMDRFYDKPMEPAENVPTDLNVTYRWASAADEDPDADEPAVKNITPKKALKP